MTKFKFLFAALLISCFSQGQEAVIDKVIGVVSKYPILLSDLQNAALDAESQNVPFDKCRSFEMLVFQKLLVAQADRDSVTVTDADVDTELNRRMAHYIEQFGTEEKLEKFYGKRTNVIKDELRAEVQEQLIAEKMNGKIAGEAKLTPAEVRQFYNKIPYDSLPLIESEVELQHLVKKPDFSPAAKKEAKDLLESYRQRVLKGQTTTSTLARLYSEDPGSARDGGFYGSVPRGRMDPSFEAVAFRLKNGEISNVFETAYGYHFIELVPRRGELLDLRHILIMPKMTNEDFYRCKQQLDSIYSLIREGKISFEDAVRKYSDDADTKQNGGLMVNPQTRSTKFNNDILSQLDKNLIVTLNGMKNGDISKPMTFTSMDNKPGYRIVKLKNRIDPHKANLKEDYQRMSDLANMDQKQKEVKAWIKKRSKITYIKLDPEYACKFEQDWIINN